MGQAARTCSARAARRGSPAATIPISISRTGAPRRRSRGCPPAAACRWTTMRSTRARRSRSTPTPASSRGTTSTRPAKRSISTSSSSACSSTIGNQKLVFTVGKDGVLWKLDRKTGKYLGHKETVFQNVWAAFNARPAAAVSRRHHRAGGRRVDPGVPEHGRAATTGRR